MRTADLDLLFVSGLNGSGPDHWQTRWRTRLPTARLVEQADWDRPNLSTWTDAVIAACESARRPVVLVAHSLGVTTVIHAAPRLPEGAVRGAFLVAPPADEALSRLELGAFAPTPAAKLPFPSLLVASSDDPFGPYSAAEMKAARWGARLVPAGAAGHINAESGRGPWPEGLVQFAAFIKSL